MTFTYQMVKKNIDYFPINTRVLLFTLRKDISSGKDYLKDLRIVIKQMVFKQGKMFFNLFLIENLEDWREL